MDADRASIHFDVSGILETWKGGGSYGLTAETIETGFGLSPFQEGAP
jgi:hypothetical protein